VNEDEVTVETYFLVPIREDVSLGAGQPHKPEKWEQLERDLFASFKGWSPDKALVQGCYEDPDPGEQVFDGSRRYTLALRRDEVPRLRAYLRQVAVTFRQKSIFLYGSRYEFCQAVGLDGTLLSHVLNKRKHRSMTKLQDVLDSLGYRLKLEPKAQEATP